MSCPSSFSFHLSSNFFIAAMSAIDMNQFFTPGDPTEIFDKMKVIGEGAFGAVYSVRCQVRHLTLFLPSTSTADWRWPEEQWGEPCLTPPPSSP